MGKLSIHMLAPLSINIIEILHIRFLWSTLPCQSYHPQSTQLLSWYIKLFRLRFVTLSNDEILFQGVTSPITTYHCLRPHDHQHSLWTSWEAWLQTLSTLRKLPNKFQNNWTTKMWPLSIALNNLYLMIKKKLVGKQARTWCICIILYSLSL